MYTRWFRRQLCGWRIGRLLRCLRYHSCGRHICCHPISIIIYRCNDHIGHREFVYQLNDFTITTITNQGLGLQFGVLMIHSWELVLWLHYWYVVIVYYYDVVICDGVIIFTTKIIFCSVKNLMPVTFCARKSPPNIRWHG